LIKTITAIARQGDEFRAVRLRRTGASYQLLWQGRDRSAVRLISSALSDAGSEKADFTPGEIVAGFDCSSVAFYGLELPSVETEELAGMIDIQAEALLPLPMGQMEYDWCAGQSNNNKVPVTIAAAKTDLLRRYVTEIQPCKPVRILLNCEALVKTWQRFFDGSRTEAVIVYIGKKNTLLCQVRNNRFRHAVTLDLAWKDLDTSKKVFSQNAERLAHDMRSALERFGYFADDGPPVVILSNGLAPVRGLNVSEAVPQPQKCGLKTELSTSKIHDYLLPVGLALMELEADVPKWNLFKQLYQGETPARKTSCIPPLKISLTAALILLATYLLVSYRHDVISLARMQNIMKGSETASGINTIIESQKLRQSIARNRPDILELLSEVTDSGNEGIMIDSFYFKKGQRVKINGHAKKTDQLQKFQQNLKERKCLSDVKRENAVYDEKQKKIKFTMTFNYL